MTRTGNSNIFVLPRGEDRYYVYSPLRRSLAVVNGAAVNALSHFLKGETDAYPPSESEIINILKDHGVIGGPEPDPPVFPTDCVFQPHEVTLFPTSRCNLRCRYCYADAGKKSCDMPWEIAKAAIDLVAENAGLLGSKKFAVGFHGGGEPTLAWDLMVHAVDYAHEKAEQMGLEADIFAATNCLLSPTQREYIARRFTNLSVSLDGPADVQDYNRPKVNGSGSYREIHEALKQFNAEGLRYGIRATITAATVHRMEEIVEYLHEEFQLEYLHLEPVWHCGRCLTSGERPPTDDEFIEHFLRAAEKGRERGIEIHYSGARLDVLTSKFCAAPGDGFTVLPEGIATSCYEITEASDPRAATFHYGRYDAETGRFVFDQERLTALRKFSVEHLDFCRDCFCKWHCAGDCLAKVFEKSGSETHNGSVRCKLNRALTMNGLDRLVETERSIQ